LDDWAERTPFVPKGKLDSLFSSRLARRHACIGGEASVYTPAGARRLADLKPGEYIYSFDDYTLAERKCLEVACRGRKPVSRVTLEDGRSILSTSDQLMVKVSDPKTNLKWAMRWFSWEPLSEFKVGHTVIAAKASPEGIVQKPLIEDLIEDEEFARFIGFRDSSLAEYAVNPFYDETYTELLNIQALEAEGEAEVYEVSVDLDESFVANGFVLL